MEKETEKRMTTDYSVKEELGETMLEILSYLFDRYVNSGVELWLNYDSLIIELEQRGFDDGAIDQAFAWMERVIHYDVDDYIGVCGSTGTRIFSLAEQNKLGSEACGFLHFLVQCETIDSVTRERIIDCAMALPTHVVTLDQFKWVTTLVMLNGTEDRADMDRAVKASEIEKQLSESLNATLD